MIRSMLVGWWNQVGGLNAGIKLDGWMVESRLTSELNIIVTEHCHACRHNDEVRRGETTPTHALYFFVCQTELSSTDHLNPIPNFEVVYLSVLYLILNLTEFLLTGGPSIQS